MIRKTDNISINSWVIIKQSIIILSLVHPSGNLETSHPEPWEHEIYWKNKDVPVLSVRWSLESRAPRWYQCSRCNYTQWTVLINRSGSCSFDERRVLGLETGEKVLTGDKTWTSSRCYDGRQTPWWEFSIVLQAGWARIDVGERVWLVTHKLIALGNWVGWEGRWEDWLAK